MSSQDVSALLGQYLLQGYCMMGTHCPTCNTVHMRTRDKSKTICVKCDVIDKDKKKPSEPKKEAATEGNQPQAQQQPQRLQAAEDGGTGDEKPVLSAVPPGRQPDVGDEEDLADESDASGSGMNTSRDSRRRSHGRHAHHPHHHHNNHEQHEQMHRRVSSGDSPHASPSMRANNIYSMQSPAVSAARQRTLSSSSARRRAVMQSPSIQRASQLSDSLRQRFGEGPFAESRSADVAASQGAPMTFHAEVNPMSQGFAAPSDLFMRQQQQQQQQPHQQHHHHHQQQAFPFTFDAAAMTAAADGTGESTAMDAQSRAAVNHMRFRCQVTIEALNFKLQQATELLERASSYQETLDVSNVIAALGHALAAMKALLQQ
ncbi:hypothetical protein PTSG_06422 [Salpingoeca rosetta]|uniref:Uncharacterized protein n=1 Tax=Salpingoeca rosetta (strain ATCC 50818 / BSB-021) TaxID=946362 RepID=F2UBZ6_SALR5|nr:uncharacterized protein PTSG_06422 [Salpingoeca rosetta]EGD74411.1 hypothetical protein PTSG_06422 [Salpingoeca rosetta]|eukprot:XP_004993311.1 hypothetical protein PTSG_06422 [Salpingoeca rosetta]